MWGGIKNSSSSLGAAGVRDKLNLSRPGKFLCARGRERVQFHGADYTRLRESGKEYKVLYTRISPQQGQNSRRMIHGPVPWFPPIIRQWKIEGFADFRPKIPRAIGVALWRLAVHMLQL